MDATVPVIVRSPRFTSGYNSCELLHERSAPEVSIRARLLEASQTPTPKFENLDPLTYHWAT